MGVSGVAWATFYMSGDKLHIGYCCSAKKNGRYKNTEENPFIFDYNIKKIVVIAVPSILQQSFISVGNIIIQGVINSFGPGVIAGYSAAIKLNNLVITSFTTIGNGISNYTAQNIGAGILARVKSGFCAGVKMVWLICTPL